jgi:hypothetical protein
MIKVKPLPLTLTNVLKLPYQKWNETINSLGGYGKKFEYNVSTTHIELNRSRGNGALGKHRTPS